METIKFQELNVEEQLNIEGGIIVTYPLPIITIFVEIVIKSLL